MSPLQRPECFSKEVRNFVEDYAARDSPLDWEPFKSAAIMRWPEVPEEVIECALWIAVQCIQFGVVISPVIWQENDGTGTSCRERHLFSQLMGGIILPSSEQREDTENNEPKMDAEERCAISSRAFPRRRRSISSRAVPRRRQTPTQKAEGLYHCRGCDAVFDFRRSRWRHEQNCHCKLGGIIPPSAEQHKDTDSNELDSVAGENKRLQRITEIGIENVLNVDILFGNGRVDEPVLQTEAAQNKGWRDGLMLQVIKEEISEPEENNLNVTNEMELDVVLRESTYQATMTASEKEAEQLMMTLKTNGGESWTCTPFKLRRNDRPHQHSSS